MYLVKTRFYYLIAHANRRDVKLNITNFTNKKLWIYLRVTIKYESAI